MTEATQRLNDLGLPIGHDLTGWTGRALPPVTPIVGRYCRLEHIDADRHGGDLFAAFTADTENRIWTYLPYGPFSSPAKLKSWVGAACSGADPLFHAVVDQDSGKALGMASYLNIKPEVGVIEVGHINFGPDLQRTPGATEAMFLMMRRVFAELGYRRCEWKCDALNARSRSAAARLGFTFEGVFRNATIYKGRNRDTAWHSITDSEWPPLERALEEWLDPGNFTSKGKQKQSLANFIGRRRKRAGAS